MKHIKWFFFLVLVCGVALQPSCLDFSKKTIQPYPTLDSLGLNSSRIDRFTIVGNTICAANGATLKTYDITDPAHPMHLTDFQQDHNIQSVRAYKDSLLVLGQEDEQLGLYDVGSGLKSVLSIDESAAYDPFVPIANNLISLTFVNSGSRAQLNVYNIPLQALLYTNQQNLVSPRDMAADSSGKLFVCDAGLKVFDADTVTNIYLIKHFNIDANLIKAYGDHLLIMGNEGLYQYQYSTGSLNLLGKIDIVP